MQPNQTQQEALDPQVVNLAKAIRQTESGGNFQAKGKSGEYGAYQFTEPTWKSYSAKYGITTPLEKATPEEQNQVAYKQIKEWKDKGNNIGQIASMWNAGEAKKDAYLKGHSGVNQYGVKYDTGAYAKSVAEAYQKLKGGQQVGADPKNPSSIASTNPVIPTEQPKKLGAFGEKTDDSLYGKIIDNSITRGITKAADFLTFGGTSALGKETGAAIAQGGQFIKDAATGSNVAPYMQGPDIAKQATGAAGILAGVGMLAGPKMIGAGKGGGVLNSKPIQTILKGDLGADESIKTLTAMNKADILFNVSKTASAGEKPLIKQALKELSSQILLENGARLGLGQRTMAYLRNNPILSYIGYQQLEPAARKFLEGLYSKYIGNQITGPNPNNVYTVNPAP